MRPALSRVAAAFILATGGALSSAFVAVAQPDAPQRSEGEPAHGPVLWRNVRSGMTFAEVRKLEPHAHAPAKQINLFNIEAHELLETVGSFQGKPSQVRFFFSGSGKLLVVGEFVESGNLSSDDVSSAVNALNAKYGSTCNVNGRDFLGGCEWLRPPIAVVMADSVKPEGFPVDARFSNNFISIQYMEIKTFEKLVNGR